MQNVDWGSGKTVYAPEPDLVQKACEGENCLDTFLAKWPTERRCERCRKEKRPYKKSDSPF